MSLKTFTKLFYLHQFFFDLIFIYAVEKLFFLSRGLNLSQIGIMLFIWSVMEIIFEVPTGILADKWSRRKMLILSGIFYSGGYFLLLFSHSFYQFLLYYFLRTLGSTFTSGTLQAYLYDFLKLNHKEEDFEKIWGRGNALRTFGIGVAVATGGFLSMISYETVLIASLLSILSISVITFFWPEIKPTRSTEEVKLWQFVSSSFKTVLSKKVILKLIIFTAIVLAALGNLEEFNDVYLKFLGFPNSVIGLIFALTCASQSLASVLAYRLKDYAWKIINFSTLFSAGILFLAALVRHPLMAVAILTLSVIYELTSVLKEGIIQKETESYQRATVSSLSNVMINILPLQMVFGLIASHYNLQTGYFVLGLVVLSYFPLSFVTNIKN